jgi:hypothetical protein
MHIAPSQKLRWLIVSVTIYTSWTSRIIASTLALPLCISTTAVPDVEHQGRRINAAILGVVIIGDETSCMETSLEFVIAFYFTVS